MKISLWALTALLLTATVITPSPLGTIIGSLAGVSLGLSVCITIAGRKA